MRAGAQAVSQPPTPTGTLTGRWSGQWACCPLVASEKVPIGGPTSSRSSAPASASPPIRKYGEMTAHAWQTDEVKSEPRAKTAAAKEGADDLVHAGADLRASAPMQPRPSLRPCFAASGRPAVPLVRLAVAHLQLPRVLPVLALQKCVLMHAPYRSLLQLYCLERLNPMSGKPIELPPRVPKLLFRT
jgi:hypothetical protein